MLSDQARDREPRLRAIRDQAIAELEHHAIHAEEPGRGLGLVAAHAGRCVTRRLTGREIDEEHAEPLIDQLRGSSPHDDLEVVRVSGHNEHVVAIGHDGR